MNIKYVFIGIIIVAVITGMTYSSFLSSKKTRKEVALILPAVHPSMEAIKEGFIATLQESMPGVHVVVYNANGNKTLLKGQAEKIVRQHYNACVAVGTNSSKMVANALAKNKGTMPLTAVAVSNDTYYDLLQIFPRVTAIIDAVDKRQQIEALLALKKVKNPLLVYDPGSSPAFEDDRKEFEKLFQEHGITLAALPVYSLQEVYQKLAGRIALYDLVLTLTDHTLCSAMDALVKLCNQHGVTLYTSELDSSEKGAALSYGVQERQYGVKAARLLKKYYQGTTLPDATKNGPFYLKINKKAAALQNLVVPLNVELPTVSVIYKKEVHA